MFSILRKLMWLIKKNFFNHVYFPQFLLSDMFSNNCFNVASSPDVKLVVNCLRTEDRQTTINTSHKSEEGLWLRWGALNCDCWRLLPFSSKLGHLSAARLYDGTADHFFLFFLNSSDSKTNTSVCVRVNVQSTAHCANEWVCIVFLFFWGVDGQRSLLFTVKQQWRTVNVTALQKAAFHRGSAWTVCIGTFLLHSFCMIWAH